MEFPELATLKDLEKKYGIPVRTWREYIKSKRLTAFKVGPRYFVHAAHVHDLFKAGLAYPHRKRLEYLAKKPHQNSQELS